MTDMPKFTTQDYYLIYSSPDPRMRAMLKAAIYAAMCSIRRMAPSARRLYVGECAPDQIINFTAPVQQKQIMVGSTSIGDLTTAFVQAIRKGKKPGWVLIFRTLPAIVPTQDKGLVMWCIAGWYPRRQLELRYDSIKNIGERI